MEYCSTLQNELIPGIYNYIDESLKHVFRKKITESKEDMLYDFIYMNYKNRPNKYVVIQIWIFTSLGEMGLRIRRIQNEIIWSNENFLLLHMLATCIQLTKLIELEHFLTEVKLSLFIHDMIVNKEISMGSTQKFNENKRI